MWSGLARRDSRCERGAQEPWGQSIRGHGSEPPEATRADNFTRGGFGPACLSGDCQQLPSPAALWRGTGRAPRRSPTAGALFRWSQVVVARASTHQKKRRFDPAHAPNDRERQQPERRERDETAQSPLNPFTGISPPRCAVDNPNAIRSSAAFVNTATSRLSSRQSRASP
jgi:hypothetical protein